MASQQIPGRYPRRYDNVWQMHRYLLIVATVVHRIPESYVFLPIPVAADDGGSTQPGYDDGRGKPSSLASTEYAVKVTGCAYGLIWRAAL